MCRISSQSIEMPMSYYFLCKKHKKKDRHKTEHISKIFYSSILLLVDVEFDNKKPGQHFCNTLCIKMLIVIIFIENILKIHKKLNLTSKIA